MSSLLPELKCRGVIFDLDGTLINSIDDIAEALNQVLADHNLPTHPIASYFFFIGEGVRTLADRALPPDVPNRNDLIDSVLSSYTSAYAARATLKTYVYPGINDLLLTLRTLGLKMAILSNKPDIFTQDIVRHYFGNELFAIVRGQTADLPRKPDPAGALLIARQLGIVPQEIVYVGDSATDMKTAVNAGMPAIGVTWGFRPEEELRACLPRLIVNRPEQIAEWLWTQKP